MGAHAPDARATGTTMQLETTPLLTPAPAKPAVRRIAFISEQASPLLTPRSPAWGRQNMYVASLARELAEAGYAIDIFTRRDAIGQAQQVKWTDRLRVIHVPAGPPAPVPRDEVFAHLDEFSRFVTRFCRRQHVPYDVVHASYFSSGMAALKLKEMLGLPFVMRFHGLAHEQDNARHAVTRRRMEDALLRAADRVIAECPQTRHDMQRRCGAASARIDVAPRGFDAQELWPVPARLARQKLGLRPGKFILLQVGRLRTRKGIDTAIDSLAVLRHHHEVDAQLLVVGTDDAADVNAGLPSEAARLYQLALQRGLGEHVIFAGHRCRNELRYYYSAADVFVSVPWHETFGITPVEAMACARPVIGAETGGIKHTVVDGETGFLVPPRDPAALAQRLSLLNANPALMRSMGDAGLRRAYQHYTWHAVAIKAAHIYASAVAGATGTAQLRAPDD